MEYFPLAKSIFKTKHHLIMGKRLRMESSFESTTRQYFFPCNLTCDVTHLKLGCFSRPHLFTFLLSSLLCSILAAWIKNWGMKSSRKQIKMNFVEYFCDLRYNVGVYYVTSAGISEDRSAWVPVSAWRTTLQLPFPKWLLLNYALFSTVTTEINKSQIRACNSVCGGLVLFFFCYFVATLLCCVVT